MSSSNKHHPKVIDDVALPYANNVNIAQHSDKPYLIAGSNILCLASSPMSRRPGFRPYTADQFAATATISRYFGWRRWSGAFYIMLSVVDTSLNTSSVYKLKVGTDVTFVLLGTDPTTSAPHDFVVSNNFVYFGNGSTSGKYDGTTATNWGINPQPTLAPVIVNAAAGNVPSIIGHSYVYAFGVAATGYVSDLSLASSLTTVVNRQWDVTGPRSVDAQCDQIHVYRTEDGGGIYYELNNSPIANPAAPTWTIRDNDYDVSQISTPRLQSVQAPLRSVNRPPIPFSGAKYFAGRIWGFVGDTVYDSGLEEVTNGVPEESFGTALTNSQSFGQEIIGLEVLGSNDTGILLVFCASSIFFISGNSLATFRIGTISRRRGCRNRATIVTGQAERSSQFYGEQTVEFVAWLDTSNTYRMMTMSGGIQDISFDIRPDLANIDHSQASATIHEDGIYRWLVLCDGGAGLLRVYDLDRGAWNVPWPMSGATTAYSVEVSSGVHRLLLGRSGRPLYMDYTCFADESVPYAAFATLHLIPLLDPANPEQVATLEFVGIETDSHQPSDVSYLLDEDPTVATSAWTSVFANVADPFLRATVDSPFQASHLSGVNLVDRWYYLRDKTGARRASMRIDWAADQSGTVGSDFSLFTVSIISSRSGNS